MRLTPLCALLVAATVAAGTLCATFAPASWPACREWLSLVLPVETLFLGLALGYACAARRAP